MKSFFYTILVFTQSHSVPLNEPSQGYIPKFPGFFKSEKPINITANDKIHSKCVCINGSIAKGVREPFLFRFALDKPPGLKIYEESRIKVFKKINKSVLSHITFSLEDDDHKPVDFNGETMSFTCQIIKLY